MGTFAWCSRRNSKQAGGLFSLLESRVLLPVTATQDGWATSHSYVSRVLQATSQSSVRRFCPNSHIILLYDEYKAPNNESTIAQDESDLHHHLFSVLRDPLLSIASRVMIRACGVALIHKRRSMDEAKHHQKAAAESFKRPGRHASMAVSLSAANVDLFGIQNILSTLYRLKGYVCM
tara:strand:- start:6 stop:536 length:531 start_codon:yes stop_codon:yes gene_type:complete